MIKNKVYLKFLIPQENKLILIILKMIFLYMRETLINQIIKRVVGFFTGQMGK